MHNLSPLPYRTAYHETVLPFRRFLVALSGRDTDCGLLRYAAMLNRILAGAEILCLHVARDGDGRGRGAAAGAGPAVEGQGSVVAPPAIRLPRR